MWGSTQEVAEHLRGQVLGCSAECLHSGTVLDTLLAQPEVRYLDVPIFVQHEVLQLCGKPPLVWPQPQSLPPLVRSTPSGPGTPRSSRSASSPGRTQSPHHRSGPGPPRTRAHGTSGRRAVGWRALRRACLPEGPASPDPQAEERLGTCPKESWRLGTTEIRHPKQAAAGSHG